MITPDLHVIKLGVKGLCPACEKASLFRSNFSLELKDKCEVCGLDFSKNDSGDGPAVFLIFILSFSLVPLAWIVELILSPALWIHAVLWGSIALALTLGSLRPLKAYIIALQYKHRASDWDA